LSLQILKNDLLSNEQIWNVENIVGISTYNGHRAPFIIPADFDPQNRIDDDVFTCSICNKILLYTFLLKRRNIAIVTHEPNTLLWWVWSRSKQERYFLKSWKLSSLENSETHRLYRYSYTRTVQDNSITSGVRTSRSDVGCFGRLQECILFTEITEVFNFKLNTEHVISYTTWEH